MDDQISFFPLTVVSHRTEYAFSFLPIKGKQDENFWGKKFTIASEKTTPCYYQAEDEDNGMTLEFTASTKSGFFNIDFKDKSNNYLRIGLNGNTGNIQQQGKRVITGTEEITGLKTYFYAEADQDISSLKYQNDADKKRMLASFDSQQVKFKYAISYISTDQAKANLDIEIPAWDFNAIKEKN